MDNQPIDFYLNRNSIEIIDKLEEIGIKLQSIFKEFKKAEITLKESEQVEVLKKVKIKKNVRFRE